MAGTKSGFWEFVKISSFAFALLILVIIMAALLVNSLINGTPQVSEKDAADNTAPSGRIYYRPQ